MEYTRSETYTTINGSVNIINSYNNSINHDQPSSDIGSYVYISIGVFMIVIFLCGCLENCCVLYVFTTNRNLQTNGNVFLVGLASGDLGQSVLNIPFVAISAFSEQWMFGHYMCQYYGLITSTFGLTQITILTVIALDRYFLIVRQRRVFSSTRKSSICTIVSCYVHGALWSLGPLLGWSRYVRDAGDISCGIDWNLKEATNLSFVLSLFICVWFLPLGFIVYSYTVIVHRVFRERRKKTFITAKRENKASKERKVAITCLIMTGFFVITWTIDYTASLKTVEDDTNNIPELEYIPQLVTVLVLLKLTKNAVALRLLCGSCFFVITWLPYSIVSLWAALDDIKNIPELAQMSTAFFAKSSIIWNPIIYFIRHDHFRSACATSLSCFRLFLNTSYDDVDGFKMRNVTNSTDMHLKSRLVVQNPEQKMMISRMNGSTRETNV